MVTPSSGYDQNEVDAATSNTSTAIEVIATDHLGVPIKVWVRTIKKTTPLQAKTDALL